jgi:hypothetical protein
MTYHQKHGSRQNSAQTNAWVLSSKRPGDRVGGEWVVSELFEKDKKELKGSERCKVTSFCYPTGARMVKAKLKKLAKGEPSPVVH